MHKDIYGVTVKQWDIVAVARNDTIHICLVTEIVAQDLSNNRNGFLVRRFDHTNVLGYTPQYIDTMSESIVSLMTSPVHVDMWNIRRELMNG